MFGFPTQARFLFPPLGLACLMVVMHLLEPLSSEYFGFYINKILEGEIWRAVTGQLLHTNTNHLLLNLGGLLLIWALHGENYQWRHFISITLIFLVLTGSTLLFFAQYQHYAGLSGILHSYLVYGACFDIRKGDKTGWLLLIGIIAKVSYENIIGAAAETESLIEAAVATEAHLVGAIVGGVAALIVLKLKE